MERRRPISVTLISLLYIIVAILLIIASIFAHDKMHSNFTDVEIVLFYILVLIGIISGIGLWMLCDWARYLLILHFLLNVTSFLLHKQSPINLGIIFEIVILCYLFLSPKITEQFKQT